MIAAALVIEAVIICMMIGTAAKAYEKYAGRESCSPQKTSSIDISGFTSPETKNNLDLAEWAITAYEEEWGYVWGTYGCILDEWRLQQKIAQYPNSVGSYSDFIENNWLGGRTADCVGLIKGYSWYDVEDGCFGYCINGMPDVGANGMYDNAEEKGEIDTIPEIVGLAVWTDGHIGVYVGDGWVIEAMSTRDGVQRTRLNERPWTHWLKIPYIEYTEQNDD